jgi:hypothetical protein
MNSMFVASCCCLLLVTTVVASSPHRPSLLTKDNMDMPSAGGNWFSFPDGAEFQQSSSSSGYSAYNEEQELDEFDAERLRQAQHRFLKGYKGYQTEFLDATSTYYDAYATAWRLLGFYIDCNANGQGDGHRRRRTKNRGLNEGNDEEDGEGEGCQRFLLWAAYVDLKYSGDEIGEYQFWDRKNSRWDDTSCKDRDGHCAKMDCHMPDTHFSLLGYFKEPNLDDWLEQLFKHEGVCLWTDTEYSFMQQNRQAWPEGCVNSKSTDSYGNYLYFDIKPIVTGGMTLALYTDSMCTQEHNGKSPSIEYALKVYSGEDNGNDDDGGCSNYEYNEENNENNDDCSNNSFQLQKYMETWVRTKKHKQWTVGKEMFNVQCLLACFLFGIDSYLLTYLPTLLLFFSFDTTLLYRTTIFIYTIFASHARHIRLVT